MGTFPTIVRALVFLLVASACSGLRGDDAAQLRRAIDALRRVPAWSHLEVDWIDGIAATTPDGPEMNVDVEVVTADGKAVAAAVVAIQESIREASTHAALVPEPYHPIRAMADTDTEGRCRFVAVKMTPPPDGKYGRIQAYLVIAHPAQGFDFYPLLRTSRGQQAKVTIRGQVSMPLVVSNASRATAVRLTRLSEHAKALYFAGFDADEVFSPRAGIDPSGSGEFASLPRGLFVGLAVRQDKEWLNVRADSLAEIDSVPRSIDVSSAELQLPIRFVDGATRRTVSRVSVDRWKRPEQISGEDGLVVIRPAFPEQIFRTLRNARLSFVVEPPSDWVRERVLDYPYLMGSIPAPQSFALTTATIVRGRVVDAKTGDGIPGVLVQSQRPGARPGGVTSVYHAVAVSDHSGAFALSAPPGRQTVSIAAPVEGFLPPGKQRLAVVPGKAVRQLMIKLTPAMPIRGRIVDKDGGAVSGAQVICHSGNRTNRYRSGFPLDSTIATALTDEDGQFAISRPPGHYESLMIKAFTASGRQTRDAIFDFDPKSNRPIEVDLELSLGEKSRSVELVGSVLKEGKPWAGAVVTASPPGSSQREGEVARFRFSPRGLSQLGQTTTDKQGNFQMVVDVSDHSVVWLAVPSTPFLQRVTLDDSRIEIPPIDVREKIGDKTIQGVVVDPRGTPVAGLKVSAADQHVIRIDRPRPENDPHRSTTNSKGEFRLGELFDGPVDVQVWPKDIPRQHAVGSAVSIPAGTSGARIIFDRSLSRVPEWIEPVSKRPLAVPSGIKFLADGHRLDAGAHIRGVVTDQKDTPILDAIVRVFCVTPADSISTDNPLLHPACRLVTKTNSQGQFTIGPFPAGAKVRIAAGASAMSASVTEFLSPDQPGAGAVIKLTRFDRNLPSMKTTHQLVDHQGNPVPAAIVATTYRRYADVLEFSSGSSPCVLTDPQGNFRFPTTVKVDYKTVAAFPIAGPASIIRNHYSHRKYRLADPMSIRGRVTDGGGHPIPNVVLRVQNDRLPAVIRFATASDGTFHIDALPCSDESSVSGIRTTSPSYYLQQRRFAPAIGQALDFGDLCALSSRRLTVRVVPAPGKTMPAGLAVRIGSKRVNVGPSGHAYFPAVAPQTGIRLEGTANVARTEPPLQKTWGKNTYAINTQSLESVVLHLE